MLKQLNSATTRRTFGWLLVLVFSSVNLLGSLRLEAAVAAPAPNQNGIQPGAVQQQANDAYNRANTDDSCNSAGATQKEILSCITNVKQARSVFKIGDKPKDATLTVNLHDQTDEGGSAKGWQPPSGVNSRFKQLAGNPYVTWTNGKGDATDNQSVGGTAVQFVLTGMNTRKGDGGVVGDVTQNNDGVGYIFQNPYNPNLTVVLWSRSGGIVPFSGNDYNRFVFAANCEDVTREGNDVLLTSNVDVSGGVGDRSKKFPDDPNGEDYKRVQEEYKHWNDCTVNTGIFGGLIKQIQQFIADALGALLGTISNWVAGIVNLGTLGTNPGLTSAWKTFRDFTNILFIIVLVVIAFSNILRVDTEKYGVRALLPRLIFAVIAVNFSFLVIQVITNVAYIVGSPFQQRAIDLLQNPPSNSLISADAGFGQFIVGVLVLLAVIIAMIILLVFFIVRIVVLWIIAALSPFVFLFMVLPLTRSLANQWWKNAVKWAFMAPIAFMILFIGAELVTGGGDFDNPNTSDPSFLLKVGLFAGVCIAAVIIPLKLGGEIMGRAAGGAWRGAKGSIKGGGLAGKLGIGAAVNKGGSPTNWKRSGEAFLEQRQANQEQAARLQAAGVAGDFSKDHPGVLGKAITGGDAGQVAVQRAALEDKHARDMETLGLGTQERKLIAKGESAKLESMGLIPAAQMAKDTHAQRAASKLLAQKGLWDNDILEKHYDTGYQALMKPYDPVMAAINTKGELDTSTQAMGALGNYTSYLGPQETREMYWGELQKYQAGNVPTINGRRVAGAQQAASTVFGNVNSAAARGNLEIGGRNVIADDSARNAFGEEMSKRHIPDATRSAVAHTLAENAKKTNDTNLTAATTATVEQELGAAMVDQANADAKNKDPNGNPRPSGKFL